MCTTIALATTLVNIPGALPFSFSRDMFLIVPFNAIASHREHHENDNLCQANRKQCQCDYAPGQQVLKKAPTKLGVRISSQYTIDHVHFKEMIPPSCILV
jgi:hypothetical protein